ncbi:hypothetical protein SD71_00990 [Cohnella kolymensis]|uniref:Alcohol dehydrogenase iron-type/glycerol dehydrogenase GldA domain-containing protein n=1 Tax=Cohnella kolymensis TaxID=1590652 RepID=A0ABR5A8F9_9BACL|nr:iron-containing alcohol dehydrogenase [Cohnella kolymensis]KIL37303.1 hypothetical protein SD71_00990 [Cohnella kolymensis]
MPTGVFTDVTHIAKVSAIDESWRQAQEHGADCIVALGGGSALVVGKATGVLGGAAKEAKLTGQRTPSIREFAFNPPVYVMPVVAIPTTAGSGAEVSPHQPMVDEENNRKITVSSAVCYPRVAILDANLMRTLPFVQATRSGVDALTHAIEACLTDQSTEITNSLALHAMQMLIQNLRKSCMTDDLQAKQACLEASCIANMACGNAKLGYVHGLARNVQTLFPVPYGETIGVFLPPVMEFNMPAALDRYVMMAPYLGVDSAGKNSIEIGEAVIYQVKKLLADLNFPRKFSEEVVDRKSIPIMAKMVFVRKLEKNLSLEELDKMELPLYGPNPNIRKATYDDFVKLYEKSFEGWEL